MSIEPESGRPPVVNLSEYLDALYSYALVLCRNRSDAEDLVQETCVRAIKAQNRLALDSNVKSWLVTILRNIWLNQMRISRSAPELTLDENRPSDTTTNPHTTYVRNAERERVRAAIQQLPIDSREIIMLRVYEEFSYQEIAVILGCPVGTVMSRLSRARQMLRLVLHGAGGGAGVNTTPRSPRTWTSPRYSKSSSNLEYEC